MPVSFVFLVYGKVDDASFINFVADIFFFKHAVEKGRYCVGVVPVENSTEGMVSHTLDNFMDSPLKICGELELRIQLHLLVNENASSDSIFL